MNVSFTTAVGKIKPMHAINNAPMYWSFCDAFHYLTEAAIPYSRLHDTGGLMGGGVFVDIANIFPLFHADPEDPRNYDFGFTDHLLRELDKAGTKPFYRLGCTIENYHPSIGPRRSIPPSDPYKWAVICEHIIRHYNEGWADGYHLGIEYWEIWNEPDNEPVPAENPMWKGTMEEFFTLYEVTANHLKSRYPHLKIGGYASCGFYSILNKGVAAHANVSERFDYFVEFFEKFLTHITTEGHKAPLDFFSWHSYAGVQDNIAFADYAREMLDRFGFTDTESILNEWNPGTHRRGTLADAAHIGAMMVALQYTSADMLMYYLATFESGYGGMFNPITREPFKAYYAFRGFGHLYKLGYQYPIEGADHGRIAEDVYALAAGNAPIGADATERAVLLFNVGGETEISSPEGEWTVSVLDADHDLTPVGTTRGGETVTLPAEGAVLLKASR